MQVVLVGESLPLLRILSVVCSRFHVSVKVVQTSRELATLREQAPDVIVFDHIQPTDLFELNPRTWGYEGPLLLLTDEARPEVALSLLRTERILRKPFHLEQLLRLLEELLSETRTA